MTTPGAWRLCVDTGGTFTDCLATDPAGRSHRVKVLSASCLRGRIGKLRSGDPAGEETAVKVLLTLLFATMVALPAGAADLGARPPAKPAVALTAAPPPDPAIQRQGGDTIAGAVRIPIPTVDLAGTTTGYADDDDVECPYDGSTSPDVVYSIVPETDQLLDIDLCGSQYDTNVWIWDTSLDWPLACNDDYYDGDECGHHTSKIVGVPEAAGAEYFIVVDGYGGDHGA